MTEERKREIMKAAFKAMWSDVVNRHVLPTSQGSLILEIQQLSRSADIPEEELGEFLRDYLDPSMLHIIGREALAGLVR